MSKGTQTIRFIEESISCVTVEISENYASSFLHIYNNVKDDEDLYYVCNDYANGVYVYCSNDVVDAVKEYLSQFGKVSDTVLPYLMLVPEGSVYYPDETYGAIFNPVEY